MGLLAATEGDPCPSCGCRDSEVVSRKRAWGAWVTKARCCHCATEFQHREVDADDQMQVAVPYVEVRCRCPKCNHPNPPVVSRPRPGLRWHKCPKCANSFKSTGVSG